jgi:hypothetical protein
MKAIFDWAILVRDGGVTMLRKIIDDLPVALSMGMEIEDQAFGSDPRKIVRLSYNLEESYIYVTIHPIELESKEVCAEHLKGYKKLGWKEPSFGD